MGPMRFLDPDNDAKQGGIHVNNNITYQKCNF